MLYSPLMNEYSYTLTQLLSRWVGKGLETCLVYTGESGLFLAERDFPDSFINFSQPQNHGS